MEIWLDTIDLDAVKDAVKTGIISGVTTNPTILSQSKNVSTTLSHLLELQTGPLAIQVTKENAQEMIEEGKLIQKLSPRCIVKVPVNQMGLEVISKLRQEGISVMGTAILNPMQALLAIKAGAHYLAPYFSHMGDHAQDYIKTMKALGNTNILAASVKTADQILFCAQAGIHAVTIKADLYYELMKPDPKVESFCQKFLQDWLRLQ